MEKQMSTATYAEMIFTDNKNRVIYTMAGGWQSSFLLQINKLYGKVLAPLQEKKHGSTDYFTL